MNDSLRYDYRFILDTVPHAARVLDLGCGDGSLLSLLRSEKSIQGVGIECDEQMVVKCIEKGVTVEHADVAEGLHDFPDDYFDFVIASFMLQEAVDLRQVFSQSLRVGRNIIISFPNFACYKVRAYLGLYGRAPRTGSLPYSWYDSPNLHFFTILDFIEFCDQQHLHIHRYHGYTGNRLISRIPNLFAESAVFHITRRPPHRTP